MQSHYAVNGAHHELPPLPLDEILWQEIATQLALSPQQARIVELILRGQRDKEIAETLGLSFSTVRTYLQRIFQRSNVTDRVGLVLHIFALSQELVVGQFENA